MKNNVPQTFAKDLNLNGQGEHAEEPKNTDQGNAQRLVARHGADMRYVHKWGKWLVYDGKRWRQDDTGEVVRRAKETVRDTYREATKGERTDKELVKHAMRSESKGAIEAMIALAQSEPGIPVRPEELDRDPWQLNCANGTVDLRTGELREHKRSDLITKVAPVEYDPAVRAPTFEAFLERILPTEALRTFVQRVLGYAASGEISEELLVILHGVGANGKSTLVNAVMAALGDYAMQAAPDLLLAKRESHPTELADLFGARFVASVETDEGRRLAEGLVKQLTGRDPIKARRMREDFWQFVPTHTVFLATNHRPEVRGTDHAIWRRLKLVPFEVTIPDAEQDKGLAAKLRAELPGILAWIVRGCLDYQREGLGEPAEVTAATASYRSDMDVIANFVEDRCVVRDGVWVKFADLYAAYTEWCDEANEATKPKRKFGALLKDRGFEPDRGTGNAPIRRGIALHDGRDPGPRDGTDAEKEQTVTQNAESRVTKSGDSYPKGNGLNPDSYAANGQSSYRSYPEGGMTDESFLHEGSYAKQGNAGNLGNAGDPGGDNPLADGSPASSNGGNGHGVAAPGVRLTEEEALVVQQLIREGMKPKFAREDVLAKRGKGGR